jgi:outer membrane protein assembly factor BamD
MNRHKEIMTDGLRQEETRKIHASAGRSLRSLILSLGSYRQAMLGLLAAGVLILPGCVLLRHKDASDNLLPTGQQPDKILYQKSIDAIDHGHYDVGRLTLQTLLNTYPDSEYLAKAKLAIANSYFQQGGTAGLTEAESEYKDFITFFPTAPEAPMAQYRVAMAHFRLMGKPDRDLTQTRLAQAEFKEFLLKYSDSPLMPRAKARLREVQEVLAEGEYEVARFYFENHANPAAKSRFEEIVNQYPSFSEAGKACWYLAQTYERLKEPKKAVPYYARILTDYPLSPMAPSAKEQLAALHQPIPEPTLATLARAHADASHNTRTSLMQRIMGTFSGAPNLSATRHGPVILSNESNNPVMMAKNPQSSSGSANSIAIQPVGDSALKNGQSVDPADPKDKAVDQEKSTDSKEKDQSGSADDTKGVKTVTAQKKKTGPLHMFKRVLKPF